MCEAQGTMVIHNMVSSSLEALADIFLVAIVKALPSGQLHLLKSTSFFWLRKYKNVQNESSEVLHHCWYQ